MKMIIRVYMCNVIVSYPFGEFDLEEYKRIKQIDPEAVIQLIEEESFTPIDIKAEAEKLFEEQMLSIKRNRK